MQHLSAPILLVDDNSMSRLLLARALEPSGYQVIQCSGGHEALAILETGQAMLLLLDYEMPELTGADVCRRVRQHPNPAISTLPIILLTGHGSEEHEIECLDAGADDFVTKPANGTTLKARIETQFRLHFLRAELREQKEELVRWRDIHERDLDAAQLAQQAILPNRLPAIPGWETAAHFQPLIQVGGDVYDWVRLSDGAWLFWVSDATGHGAAAALLTTFMKLVFLHASAEGKSPSEILNAVNADVFTVFKGRSIITAACLLIRPETDQISFAGAGHPPLLIVRHDGQVETLDTQSPPLGILPALGSNDSTASIARGDKLLLYTDGLYSRKGAGDDRLTQDDAAGFLPKNPASASDFLQRIVAAVNMLGPDEALTDDFTAVALHRL